MSLSFREKTRISQVSQPTQRSFTLEKWNEEFKRCNSATEIDLRLFQSGIFFFNKFERIRSKLKEFDHSVVSNKTLLRMIIGDLNRTCFIVRNTILDNLKSISKEGDDKTIVMEKYVERKITTAFGTSGTPDSLLEESIDGARFPLAQLLGNKAKHTTDKSLTDSEIINIELGMMTLGYYYTTLEHLWAECLWNDWHLRETDEIDIIMQSQDVKSIIRCASSRREDDLVLQRTHLALHIWSHKLSEQAKQRMAIQPKIEISGSGKNRKFQAIFSKYATDELPSDSLLARIILNEHYYEKFLEERFPNYPFLNLTKTLAIWDIFHALAEAFIQRFPLNTEIKRVNQFDHYSPIIKKN